ncbi:MAG: hypothetical protein AB1600_02525 [Bacteroidota bacterium]
MLKVVVSPTIAYVLTAILFLFLFTLFLNGRKKPIAVFSHWFHMLENFNISSQDFYTFLEKAIASRQIPDMKMYRVLYQESGILSAKREYLRVIGNDRIFDICAAPVGTCFFFSWWLGEGVSPLYRLVAKIPFVGTALIKLFKPETYYSIDTTLMFQETVHSAVLEVVNAYLKTKGLRALSEAERKPIMNKVLK